MKKYGWFALWMCAGCADGTGLSRVGFLFEARGVEGAESGLKVETPSGWQLDLSIAEIAIGALYLRNTPPNLGTGEVQGRVVAEVLSKVTVNALSAQKVLAEQPGQAVTEQALSGELRLSTIQGQPDATVLHVVGTAMHEGVSIDIDGRLNLPLGVNDGYQSVVSRQIQRLSADVMPTEGGRLVLTINPSHWLDFVDFDRIAASGVVQTDLSEAALAAQLRTGVVQASKIFDLNWIDR